MVGKNVGSLIYRWHALKKPIPTVTAQETDLRDNPKQDAVQQASHPSAESKVLCSRSTFSKVLSRAFFLAVAQILIRMNVKRVSCI